MGIRRRCTECRRCFTPSPRAVTSQRVCGSGCRAARDRKLARGRRDVDLAGYREDERLRQQASRARRKAPTRQGGPGCHTPPSARKCADLEEEVALIVARLLEASRATLVREARREVARGAPSLVEVVRGSRASFTLQACDPSAESGVILAVCHAP
jgi:hypothetical protein